MIRFFQFYTFLTIFLMALSFNSNAQIDFYQDVFYGGVTGDGYNPFNSESIGSVDIYIEPGSTVREAFLFITINTIDSIIDNSILFNGASINLSESFALNNEFTRGFGGVTNRLIYKTLVLDVSSLVNPLVSSYSITPPFGQSGISSRGVFSGFYLYISYDNPSLSKIGTSILINNQDAQASVSHSFSNVSSIDLGNDVGLTFNTDSFCNTLDDGSRVYIDGSFIGLVGGSESMQEPNCTGVRGAFYYQNSTLYGLDNDLANTTMSGIDALAEIASYISNPNIVNVRFDHQNMGGTKDETNPLNEFFLTYTTPCDTFSVSTPNDTTVCYGTQLQLNASGGQTYEWLPSTGLSCNTCPNPVFTADSTMHYTVRIWNNDSCSVVKPVQIIVSRPEIDNVSLVSPDCGTNNGQLTISGSSFSWLSINYSIDNGALQTDSVFANLAEGTYLLSLEDAAGCTADTTVFLQSVNNTVAQFNTSAGGTEVPVTVWGENTSQNATNYEWFVNGTFFSNSQDILPVFNNTGTQTIELIAWQYDPTCADTAYAQIVIQNQIIVPTAFTPDNDGVNDFWEILYLDEVYPDNQVFVYNRWGSLIYTSTKGDYAGRPWKGGFENLSPQGEELPVGSYFYVIETGVSATLDNPSSETFHNPNASETAAEALEAKLRGSVTVVR